MKHLKKFNEHVAMDLAQDIANDLYPIFKKKKDKGEKITLGFFDNFMEERGANSELSSEVLNNLVSMGINIDTYDDEEVDYNN